MPHASLKLIPGVDQNRTPALNEAAISESNLIRFVPDRQGLGLPQKLGGWTQFVSNAQSSVVRALHSWADINGESYLAIGDEDSLNVANANSFSSDISPQFYAYNLPVSVITTNGSATVTINDNNSNISSYDGINILTPISVGGIILSGYYPPIALSDDAYQIVARNIIGLTTPATQTFSVTAITVSGSSPNFIATATCSPSTTVVTVGSTVTFSGVTPVGYNASWTVLTSSAGTFTFSTGTSNFGTLTVAGTFVAPSGTVPVFTATSGQLNVLVNFPNHGYTAGSTFAILVPTTVGGLTLYGNYIVLDTPAITTNAFYIAASSSALSTQTRSMNNGQARIVYYVGQQNIEPPSGFGVGDFGSGGFGTGVTSSGGRELDIASVSSAGGIATVTINQALYVAPGTQTSITGTTNYNGTKIVTAAKSGFDAATTNASCVGTNATVTFTPVRLIPVGSLVTISGVFPSEYNGTWIVTVSSSGSVTFVVPSAISNQTTAGSLNFANVSTFSFPLSSSFATETSGTVTTNSWGFPPGYYDSTTGTTVAPLEVNDWSLDNWGGFLIANPAGNGVFYYDTLGGGDHANVIPNAPSVSEGCFVSMPERQIICYGTTFNGIQDPLLVRWTDIGNLTSWVATVSNQAGSFRIPKGSKIVGGMQGPQQGLLWTDTNLWSMQYINLPLVYSFNEIGAGCGLIGRKAMGTLGGVVYWMSQSQFYVLAGGGVQSLPCPVWDVIFQDIDTDYVGNIRCAPNSRFGEISWFYPTIGSNGVPTKYVKYNTLLQQWDFGALTRTAWIDQGVFGPPIGADDDGIIYQHETSQNAAGGAMDAYVQTGYFALSEGDNMTFLDQVWPDMKWGYYGGNNNANVNITFYAVDYPGQPPRVYGPYNVNQATEYISPRIRARLISIKVAGSQIDTFWRLGNIRYRLQPDGKY